MNTQSVKADTHEGFCSRSMLQAHFARVSTHEGAFSSSLNFPREFAPKCLTGYISWSILQGGNSAPEDEVYPWNRRYTRRSFALGACPWSMLREENPSCVSAFKTRRVRAPIDGVGKQPRPHVVYSGILISWEQPNVSYLLVVYFSIQWVIAFLPFQASTVITSLAAFLAVSKHLKIISTWK